MDRRDFLRGIAGAGAGAALPGAAHAASGRSVAWAAVEARAALLLADADTHRDRFFDLMAQRHPAPTPALAAALPVLADGAGAAAALAALDAVPIAEQVHPAMQGTILAVAERLGAALLVTAELLEPIAAGAAVPTAAMLEALAAVEQQTLAVLPAGRRAQGARTLRRMGRRLAAGEAQAMAARMLRRIRAIERLALRAGPDGRSRFLRRDDPDTADAVQAAAVRWDAEAQASGRGVRITLTVVGILGLIAAGVAIYYGYVVIALSVAAILCICIAVIGLAMGVIIIVAGAALALASVTAILGVTIFGVGGRVQQRREAALRLDGEFTGGVVVLAADGWVPTGLLVTAGERYPVHAIGETHNPVTDEAQLDAAGDRRFLGGAGHRMPGAPEGALLGAVGGQVFLIGDARSFQPPASGLLTLALNVDEAAAEQRVGELYVAITS